MTEREDAAGRRIAGFLNDSLAAIDHDTLAVLRAAREQAASRARIQEGRVWSFGWVTAGVGGGSSRFGFRLILSAAMLVIALGGFAYWQAQQNAIDEIADVDAGLLAGDLPIDAYLDKGLDAWLTQPQSPSPPASR